LPSEPVPARCVDLVKTYRTPTGAVHALRGVTLTFPAGALTAVVGPSGSGKSSLLRVLTGIDRATSGDMWVGPRNVGRTSARGLRRLRREVVGYVFQRPSDNFLPNLTIGQHLHLAARSSQGPGDVEILDRLGIGHRIDHLPDELSGGEQQRAAFAQAVVVADEPTAELDSESGKLVMDGVRALVESGVTFVVATHDGAVRKLADEVIELDHGKVKGTHTEAPSGRLTPAARYYAGARLPVDDVDPVVSVRELTKVFHHHGGDVVHALEDVSFEARPGELVGLVGRSGSGKTTLLNVIAGWEHPTAGEVRWHEPVDASSPAWSAVAVVPQKLGLMEELTVEENIGYPARLAGALDERSDDIEELIGVLGIGELRSRYPREASVGEQQRTAIARALSVPTSVLLADEPTAHQDTVSTERVFAALRRAADAGTAVMVATHNPEVIRHLDRVLTMADGRLAEAPRA
jgi:putative ABC transport system ATP-binding protein